MVRVNAYFKQAKAYRYQKKQQEEKLLRRESTEVKMSKQKRFNILFDERVDGEALLKKLSKIGKQEREELEGINELEGSEDEQDNDDII